MIEITSFKIIIYKNLITNNYKSNMLIGKFNKTTHTLLKQAPIRQFSIVAPEGKMHSINHPRYGYVYPIVSIND